MGQNIKSEGRKGFFGEYGGQFVAETLIPTLDKLETSFNKATTDKAFLNELTHYLENYAGRPTPVYYARNFSEKYGIKLYLKREDLLHTGAHKINNTLGQALLTKYMGKKRVIAETGAGQHGVATATVSALLNMECTVYMGRVDAERQSHNVERMKLLGAQVNIVTDGSETLKDAVSSALRDWVTNVVNTHYILGSAVGPHPFPEIVAYFQQVIGEESRKFFDNLNILPDCVIACVGGGSNAIGIFKGFLDSDAKLIGVEAGGISKKDGKHSASLCLGRKGIFQGSLSYILQNDNGQISDVHSVSAGLDYPGVGPEHALLKDIKRVDYVSADDNEALKGFFELAKLEGIIPALEPSHALGYIIAHADIFRDKCILLSLSGRGDKDLGIVNKYKKDYL